MLSLNNKRYSAHKSHGNKSVFIAVLVLITLLICASLFIFRSRPSSIVSSTNGEASELKIPTKKELVTGKYLFSGTIVLARAVEKSAAGNYSQPFSKLSTFQPEQYDAWLVDLECPVTTNNVSYQQQIDNLVFNCRPEWLPEFSNHFNLVNLANNHTSDMGADGFLETQKHLDEAGVQTVGSYDPSKPEDACEVIALPVRIIDDDQNSNSGNLPVAFCAFHYFFRLPKPGEMDIVKQFSDVMPTFGFMHVGVEYLPTAGQDQQSVAHSLIDKGTEFVIGNSPHWVQNSEVYKGKPIFYSTGNFIFDQLEYETNRGLNIEVTLEIQKDENIEKWLELGEKCKTRRDSCLQIAKQEGLTKPKLKLTYQPVGSKGGNRAVTEKADPTLQAAIEERLNWSQTRQQLGQ